MINGTNMPRTSVTRRFGRRKPIMTPIEHARTAERMSRKAPIWYAKKQRRLDEYYKKLIEKTPKNRRWYLKQKAEILRGATKAVEQAVRHHTRPLAALAARDDLTGLCTTKEFERHLTAFVSHKGKHYAVVYLDINNLKDVNDRHGHAEGDKLILSMSRALRSLKHKRLSKAVGRMGGDEFAVVIPIESRQKLETAISDYVGKVSELFVRNWNEIRRCDFQASFAAGSASTFEQLLVAPSVFRKTKDGDFVTERVARNTARNMVKIADQRMLTEKQRMELEGLRHEKRRE